MGVKSATRFQSMLLVLQAPTSYGNSLPSSESYACLPSLFNVSFLFIYSCNVIHSFFYTIHKIVKMWLAFKKEFWSLSFIIFVSFRSLIWLYQKRTYSVWAPPHPNFFFVCTIIKSISVAGCLFFFCSDVACSMKNKYAWYLALPPPPCDISLCISTSHPFETHINVWMLTIIILFTCCIT